MDYEVAVSPEQLTTGADSLQAMADDCGDALSAPLEPATTADDQASASRSGPRRGQDELAAAGQGASAALLKAVQVAGRAVQSSSDALRATAADYRATEQQASELIDKTIGRALGELR